MTGSTARLTETGIAPDGSAPAGVPAPRQEPHAPARPDTAAEPEPDTAAEPHSPPAPRPTGKPGSAGAVLLTYLGEHVDRLLAEERRVRAEEPDAVHQLRVNARRLRSALQAYRPLLDRERTEPVVDALREFGRHLAPARDAEVLDERISAGLAALPPELRLGGVQALTTRHFARVGADAGADVRATLDGEDYARLRAQLEDLLVRPPLTERANRPGRRELPAVARRTARRLARAVEAATDPAAPHRDEAVHAARKAAKRLRYATDVAEPAAGKPAKRFASGLKAFQKALGEHQDTVVARRALRELAAQAHTSGENGFSFGVLHGRDAARAARIEEELPALWARAWSRKNRKWLR
jgi:CHAD domain-containing protein